MIASDVLDVGTVREFKYLLKPFVVWIILGRDFIVSSYCGISMGLGLISMSSTKSYFVSNCLILLSNTYFFHSCSLYSYRFIFFSKISCRVSFILFRCRGDSDPSYYRQSIIAPLIMSNRYWTYYLRWLWAISKPLV